MFFFKKHISLKDSGIFRGFTDWHCHLLPGVEVRKKAEWLLKNALYDLTGSDARRLAVWETIIARKITKTEYLPLDFRKK